MKLEVFGKDAVAVAFLTIVANRLGEIASYSPLDTGPASFAAGDANHRYRHDMAKTSFTPLTIQRDQS